MDNDNQDEKKTPIGLVTPLKRRAAPKHQTPSPPKQPVDSSFRAKADARVRVLFLRSVSESSDLLDQKLREKGFHVTNIRHMTALREEWELGVYDLVLVDDLLPVTERLLLLQAPKGRERPIPVIMLFPPGCEQDTLLMLQRGAIAALVRDGEGEYLSRIPNIVESYARENNLGPTREISFARPDFSEETKEIDIKSMAKEIRGEFAEVQVALLIVSGGPDLGKSATLGGDLCVIGRDLACQLTLSDDSISRFHASVKRLPNGDVFLKDLDSTNGTFHKGRRITSVMLKNNEQFHIGLETVISVRLPKDQG